MADPICSCARVRPPRGVLLHGPPGSGKMLLARAMARQAGANFIAVKSPELLSKYVGASEKGVRDVLRKARKAASCVVFFDEIDAVAPRRGSAGAGHVTERVVAQMLSEMDGVEDLRGVVVLAAINRVDMLDPALLRPGPFDRVIEIHLTNGTGLKSCSCTPCYGRVYRRRTEPGHERRRDERGS